MSTPAPVDLTSTIRQSPRLTFPGSFSSTHLSGQTILITGGASGFGAACVSRWAAAGATVIFGDVSRAAGQALESSVRHSTRNPNVHFQFCDVTVWMDQVALFRKAVEVSAHGGVDHVVANAGIADERMEMENPRGMDEAEPKAPDLRVLDVNLVGVVYTAHLAMWYLPRNPKSLSCSPDREAGSGARDRHLLLVGSIASLGPIPMQTLYGAAKHGVLGTYRCLRATSFRHGVRVSLVAPYFMDTPIVTTGARILLAGAEMGRPEDVVTAMTRFCADSSICGRAVVIGPRLRVGQWEDGGEGLMPVKEEGKETVSIWEFHGEDFESVEVWNRRMIGMLNRAELAKGWVGWGWDMLMAVRYGLGNWWAGKGGKHR